MIEVGKTAGFCGGVELCVKRLEQILQENKEVYCIGDVVHNNEVVKHFKDEGLIVINSLKEIEDGKNLVIRAHGAVKELYEECEKRNIKVFDLTCPKVLKIRDLVTDYLNDESYIVLIAQKEHPETLSTISFCEKNSCIMEDEKELDKVVKKCNKYKKVLVIGQTTFGEHLFDEYSKYIKEHSTSDVEIKKTICNATSIRQKETEEMSKVKDCMIIIGGAKSSNTHKLYDIASSNCPNTYIVETSKDINVKEISKYHNIGIMAGASTPATSIKEVVELLGGTYEI